MQQKGPAARRGFTLMETLAVVALIVVLLAVALPSLGKAGRELRGAELDADAQTLLAAAQSSMERLAAASRLDELAAAGVPAIPADNNALFGGDTASARWATNDGVGSGAFALLLPESGADGALPDHHVLIEFDPAAAKVLGVFYSEGDLPLGYSGSGLLPVSRGKDARRAASLGYCGPESS